MFRRLLGVSLLWVWSSGAAAMPWQELQSEINSVEAGNQPDMAIIRRTAEMVEMLVGYHRALRSEGAERLLFCPQAGGSMELDEVVSLIRFQARKQNATPDTLVQSLLLDAFRSRFPCD